MRFRWKLGFLFLIAVLLSGGPLAGKVVATSGDANQSNGTMSPIGWIIIGILVLIMIICGIIWDQKRRKV